MATDFDFKIGRGHYRGTGTRGLIALTIICVTRAATVGAGGLMAYSWFPGTFQRSRAHAGY